MALKGTKYVLNEDRARQVLETTLGVSIAPGADLRREDEPKWDSLKHVVLIFAIEDEFDIQLEEEQMERIDSLSAILNAIDAA